jgi:hypothetical protein
LCIEGSECGRFGEWEESGTALLLAPPTTMTTGRIHARDVPPHTRAQDLWRYLLTRRLLIDELFDLF